MVILLNTCNEQWYHPNYQLRAPTLTGSDSNDSNWARLAPGRVKIREEQRTGLAPLV